jgi:nitrite reductase/ring-hydroxylating ferredoxin subunit
MNDEMNRSVLCPLEVIADPGGKGFVLGTREIFVVRRGDAVHGYENSCPHTGVPLDWMPDQFLNLDGDLIQCSTHHALFRIEDGACVAGPCAGRGLQPVGVAVIEGQVVVVEP